QGVGASAGGRTLRPEPGRHRRGVAARQRDLVLAARPQRAGAGKGRASRRVQRQCRRFGRGPVDDRGGDGGGGAGQRADHRIVRALSQPRRAYVRGTGAVGDALRLRRA
ncbi:hypothetical protein LTR94_036173, partial [Friedmanniomyces endolithicus]